MAHPQSPSDQELEFRYLRGALLPPSWILHPEGGMRWGTGLKQGDKEGS